MRTRYEASILYVTYRCTQFLNDERACQTPHTGVWGTNERTVIAETRQALVRYVPSDQLSYGTTPPQARTQYRLRPALCG